MTESSSSEQLAEMEKGIEEQKAADERAKNGLRPQEHKTEVHASRFPRPGDDFDFFAGR